MPNEQTNIREREGVDLREPRRFKVVIYNDDFTPMDFVVMILRQIFFLPEEMATTLMLKVHNQGKAVVGIYTYDIARSKMKKAFGLAQESGYPLRLSVEPEDKNR